MKYKKGKGFPFKKERNLPEEEQQRITDRQNDEFLKSQKEEQVVPEDKWRPTPITPMGPQNQPGQQTTQPKRRESHPAGTGLSNLRGSNLRRENKPLSERQQKREERYRKEEKENPEKYKKK